MKSLIVLLLTIFCCVRCFAQTSPDSVNAETTAKAAILLSDSSNVNLSSLDPQVREEVLRQLRKPGSASNEVLPKSVNFEGRVNNTLLVVGGIIMAIGCAVIISDPGNAANTLLGTVLMIPGGVIGLIGLVGKILD